MIRAITFLGVVSDVEGGETNNRVENEESSFTEKLGAQIDKILEEFFEHLGFSKFYYFS